MSMGSSVRLATESSAPVQTTAKTRLHYRPDIDGIRGAAAIMVMGYHAKVPGFEGSFIGLDLFFVVSGFVITGLLFGELTRNGRIDWPSFYARRARRLIPAKATMLVGVLILSYFLMPPTGAQQSTAKSVAAASGFISNFFFWKIAKTDYFGHEPGTGVLLHTWSLSVEEQFYLGVPLVIVVALAAARIADISSRRALLISAGVLSLGSLALAIALAGSHPDAAYYLPFTRAFEFGIGVVLALVVPQVRLRHVLRQAMGVLGGLVILAVLLNPLPVDGYPTYWALLPCGATVLVIWAGSGSPTLVNRFLSSPLLVWLGVLSYGWYLWHWPLLVMGEAVNLAPTPLPIRVGLVLIGLGLSWLSWRFVEGHFYSRAGSRRLVRSAGASRRVLLTGVTAMALVATTAGGAFLLAQDKAGSERWIGVSEQLNDVPRMPDYCLEPGDLIPQSPEVCRLNRFVPDHPTVVLWGDSHAWMFIPGLHKAARRTDVNLVTVVMGGCPPFDPALPPKSRWSGVSSCEKLNDLGLRFVKRLHQRSAPVRVILGASWESYRGVEPLTLNARRDADPQHQATLDTVAPLVAVGTPRLFRELGSLGIGTDVIAPTVAVPRSAPLCEAVGLFSCDLDREEARAREAGTLTWLTRLVRRLPPDAQLINVNNALCDRDVCHAELDGIVSYFDDNHLSATRARALSTYFRPSVLAAVDPASMSARPNMDEPEDR